MRGILQCGIGSPGSWTFQSTAFHQRMQKIFDTLCCDVQIAVTSTDLMRKIRESSYQSMGGNQLEGAQELRI